MRGEKAREVDVRSRTEKSAEFYCVGPIDVGEEENENALCIRPRFSAHGEQVVLL